MENEKLRRQPFANWLRPKDLGRRGCLGDPRGSPKRAGLGNPAASPTLSCAQTRKQRSPGRIESWCLSHSRNRPRIPTPRPSPNRIPVDLSTSNPYTRLRIKNEMKTKTNRPNWIGTVRDSVNFALGRKAELGVVFNDKRNTGRRIKFYSSKELTDTQLHILCDYIELQKPGVRARAQRWVNRGSWVGFGNYVVHLQPQVGTTLPE